uniref:Uncharacterized protein n=1 Tax=Arundo donax TaxID=35708 RepID=A0A0A9GH50_ARUDO
MQIPNLFSLDGEEDPSASQSSSSITVQGGSKLRSSSTPAAGDAGAAAAVGVGLGAGAAVVVAGAAPGARHAVAPERAVADVPGAVQDAAVVEVAEPQLVAGQALAH